MRKETIKLLNTAPKSENSAKGVLWVNPWGRSGMLVISRGICHLCSNTSATMPVNIIKLSIITYRDRLSLKRNFGTKTYKFIRKIRNKIKRKIHSPIILFIVRGSILCMFFKYGPIKTSTHIKKKSK